jgi:hypothetical protein
MAAMSVSQIEKVMVDEDDVAAEIVCEWDVVHSDHFHHF